MVFSTDDTRPVRKLTLTVTKLAQAQIWLPHQYVLMLNELLVFSGEENIALNAPVSAEKKLLQPLKFDPAYLVDGYSYFPPVEPEVKTTAANSLGLEVGAGKEFFLIGSLPYCPVRTR